MPFVYRVNLSRQLEHSTKQCGRGLAPDGGVSASKSGD
ncbi:hypothetical protein C4J94_0425 [Pseudomonas sp. R5-89-07]|nr:hypothetical protein C4J94_0425 [Pseudomonas sp. R5-89-07]